MSRTRRPRSPSRLLLRLTLPHDERDAIVAELEEAVRRRYPRRGVGSWLWFWRQSLIFSARFVAERGRERRRFRRDHPPGTREQGMSGLWRDLGYALRLLVKQPAFTAVVMVTLALGIGPNTAIFSVVNGVLLRPLPYDEPERLGLMRVDLSGLEAHPGIARAEVLDFREQAETLADVGAVSREFNANLTEQGRMEAVLGAQVTPNLFSMLGVRPFFGRYFSSEEAERDAEPTAILSHRLWQRRYGDDRSIVGKTIEVNNRAVTVVGVLPPGFSLLLGPGTSLSPEVDYWVPLVLPADSRGFWAYRTIARLAPGATFEQAGREVEAIGAALVEQYPEAYENSGIRFYLHPLHGDLVQDVRPAILTLLGAVGLVLLIACTNAASLLLARMKVREKEIAVRAALGARRGRIVRQVLIESMVLAMGAGVLGLALGSIGLDTLLALQPGGLPRVEEIGLDQSVLAFTLLASFVASVAFGIIPAWQASRPDLHEALKVGGRSGGGIRNRTRGLLVVAQVAFSVMLLIGAGLLLRTFASLRGVDLGFQPESVITMQASFNGSELREPEARWAKWQAFLGGVRELPGVSAVGGVSILPLSNQGMMASYGTEEGLGSDWNGTSADYRFVLPGYFDAMGIPLLSGRVFEGRDNDELIGLAIIDDTLARQTWPGESPVGKRIALGLGSALNQPDSDETVFAEVVGVVAHSRSIDIRRQVRPQIYLPYRTSPRSGMVLTVRASGDPDTIVSAIRQETERLGMGRPVHTVRAMDSYVDDALGGARFALMLMTTLAGIALLLSTVGIYSVVAYLVRQRARETGIRLALGAERGDIVRVNLREGLLMAAGGVPIGLFGAVFFARSFEGLLFGVASTDPVTFVGIPLLLLAVAGLASYLPAQRATRVDPMVALRQE